MKKEVRQNLSTQIEKLLDCAYSNGWSDGHEAAKEKYASANKGVAKMERATPKQRESWGHELFGWCTECGKAIEGRWVGLANFCPWCGRVMDWEEWKDYQKRIKKEENDS